MKIRDQLEVLSERQKVELYSTACDPKEDVTRQEFKDECDTSKILARFGAGQTFRQPQSGVMDFDMTLQDAIHAVRDAAAAFERLPDDIRNRYRGWGELELAILSGEYKPAGEPAGGSGGSAGGSASDSAAGSPPEAG